MALCVGAATIEGLGNSGLQLLLISFPNSRAPLVKARGLLLRDFNLLDGLTGGAGEISIGTQSEGKETRSRGGEFKETLEAKEISRSEDRTSSTISLFRINRWLILRDGANGGLRN